MLIISCKRAQSQLGLVGYDIVNAWAEWDQDDQNIEFRSSSKIKPGPFCQINLRIKSRLYLLKHSYWYHDLDNFLIFGRLSPELF